MLLGYDFVAMAQEIGKDLERFVLSIDSNALNGKLEPGFIEFSGTEAVSIKLPRRALTLHCQFPSEL
jgi:hypothetical protein